MKYIIFNIISLLTLFKSTAQTADVYIPQNSTVGFFNTDTTAIFGNMINDGKIYLPTRSYIYFLGQNWRNNMSNAIVDESLTGISLTGGTIQFRQPEAALTQHIFGGYTAATQSGTYFPNLDIHNPAGVIVENGSDVAVRNTLTLSSGKINIYQTNLVIGSPARRGIITGYNNSNYIVTAGGPFGGFLYRLRVPTETDSTVLPIGTERSYTPASIVNYDEPDDYRARVFDGVYRNGLSGSDISHLSTGKTWIVANTRPAFNTSVRLQHQIAEEGSLFSTNRSTAYISHLKSGDWDTSTVYTTPTQPGTITTGAAITSAASLHRTLHVQNTNSYLFTAFTRTARPNNSTTSLDFTARRISNVMAALNLAVTNESNVFYYEIQRRKDNEANWTTLDSIVPTNLLTPHSYAWFDRDVYYRGLIHYRIRIISFTGAFTYSPERSIPGIEEPYFVQVFPNPGFGEFNLRILNMPDAEMIVVYDQWGDAIITKRITGELTPFDLRNYPSAVYYVSIYGKEKRKLHTEKIIKLKR